MACSLVPSLPLAAVVVVATACLDPSISPPAATARAAAAPSGDWSASELARLRSLSLDALPPVPPAPSTRVADDLDAARLGHRLFFEPALSSNGRVACASCHVPALFFTDGLPVSTGIGPTQRNSPTVVASAYSPWQYWDGRRDSAWAQALAPFESAAEMNLTRLEVVRRVAADPEAGALYRKVFGAAALPDFQGRHAALPQRAGPFGDPGARDAWARIDPADREAIDRAFANLGKALAAYQRRLVPGPGRFDRYVRSLTASPEQIPVGARTRPAESGAESGPEPEAILDARERLGLRLFIDAARTQCLRCHNGPLFTNQGFHRIGTEYTRDGMIEFGRFLGVQAALVDPFNCLGAFSDAEPGECRELRFLRRDHIDAEVGKFKTPTLRGLRVTAPYMHDGRLASLRAVVDHYREPPPNPPDAANRHELLPLELSPEESEALAAFLASLGSEIDAEAKWLAPPAPAIGRR